MQRIINFIIQNKNHLLFVFLFAIALGFTIQSHSYHSSKYFNSANAFSGNLFSFTHGISNYMGLQRQNENLIQENKNLREELLRIQNSNLQSISVDSLYQQFTITTAAIINNNYIKKNNYLTINKGSNHGIEQDMGVITSNGIIGIVEHTSKRFATIQSILNTRSNINAKIKNTDYFGSLKWDLKSPKFVQLADIERFVPIKKGDTIITGGKSTIFPQGIPIGVVETYSLNEVEGSYDIQVALFNDMTNLKHVYIIKNNLQEEIQQLEQMSEDGQ
ncbi:MAG: rod shape-determining protein MreC [Flavobacteriaceae bacterium]|nr:rod shape-determining protein MreC [Flavobacteriaceae bacterium]